MRLHVHGSRFHPRGGRIIPRHIHNNTHAHHVAAHSNHTNLNLLKDELKNISITHKPKRFVKF